MRRSFRLLLLAASALAATAASAHPADLAHAHAGFLAGLVHPLTGPDHLAAMLAVGAWSTLAIRPAWLAPLAFLAMLALGAYAGSVGMAVPAVEPVIAASLLVLGLLLAARQVVPRAAAAALVGGFAFFHGAAHGVELGPHDRLAALAGMLCATAGLHAGGGALARLLRDRGAWPHRLAGSGVALFGAALLARLA